MNEDAHEIRRDIERTRERLSETVEALAYKTDVPARARDAVSERIETVKETLAVARDAVVDAGTIDVPQTTKRFARLAQSPLAAPIAFGVAAFAVGALAGSLVPLPGPRYGSSDVPGGSSAIPTR